MSACTATKEAVWLKQLLKDIEYRCEGPIVLNIDNQSAIRLIKNPEFHKRTKHIDVRYHFIREKYNNGEINIKYISIDIQLADLFTKALSKDRFRMLRECVGMFNVDNVLSE